MAGGAVQAIQFLESHEMGWRQQFISSLRGRISDLQKLIDFYSSVHFQVRHDGKDVTSAWIRQDRQAIERLRALIAQVETDGDQG